MKKITFLFTLLTVSIGFTQNLIQDGGFDTQTGSITTSTSPWTGFHSQVLGPAHAQDPNVGNVNNGEGSIIQVFTVTPGETYNVVFDHKWVSGTGNYNMTVRVKDDLASGKPNLDLIDGTTTDGFALDNASLDFWYTGNTFSFLAPTGVTQVRLLFYKEANNRPLRIDNVSVALDATASLQDLAHFNFKSYPNPVQDVINFSAAKNIKKISICNLLGQEVLNQDLNSKTASLNVSSFAKGVYVVKAQIEDAVGSYKFIKE